MIGLSIAGRRYLGRDVSQERAISWGSHHPWERGRVFVHQESLGLKQGGLEDVLAVHWPNDNAAQFTLHLHCSQIIRYQCLM